MIVVAGGTGRLGSIVANRLCESEKPVRVVSRGLAPRPGTLDSRVEVVRGDVREAATLREPLEGADVVVSAVQGFAGPGAVTPASVDRDGNRNLVEAAEAAGADVVLVSVTGASPESAMELHRMKYAAEQRLRAGRCRWTIVRAEAYAETWVDLLDQTAGGSGRPLVFGRGDNPVAWVSVEDVAALVVRAVEDQTLRGQVLEICGPDPLTLMQLAQAYMDHRGSSGRPRRVPRAMLHVMAGTVGRLKPELGRQARAALAMDLLPLADDAETRRVLPDLTRRRVSDVIAELPVGVA
jgi:uncharacterized protein YbjT (DUF2867 family)